MTRILSIALIIATVVSTAGVLFNAVSWEEGSSVTFQMHHSAAPDITTQLSEDEEEDATNHVKKEATSGLFLEVGKFKWLQTSEIRKASNGPLASTDFLTLLQIRI